MPVQICLALQKALSHTLYQVIKQSTWPAQSLALASRFLVSHPMGGGGGMETVPGAGKTEQSSPWVRSENGNRNEVGF